MKIGDLVKIKKTNDYRVITKTWGIASHLVYVQLEGYGMRKLFKTRDLEIVS
jgi:hypothetical protein